MRAVRDIRMKGFQERVSVAKMLTLIDSICYPKGTEWVPVRKSVGRILALGQHSNVDVPGFRRSAMDGYAIIAEESFGAAPYNPILFHLVGQSAPGAPFGSRIQRGEAVQIMTGAPLPEGADAVIMAEYTALVGSQVEISDSVTPGRNVNQIGEDVRSGALLFERGRALRPQDSALMASVGLGQIPVLQRPTVDLLITGNELLMPGESPKGSQIVDSNSLLLQGCIERDGGVINSLRYARDEPEQLRKGIMEAQGDILCITGGTAVGPEDFVPLLIAEAGELLAHGVAVRPASPTGLGIVGKKLVFLLPGNPVSCLCAYDLFVGRAVRSLGGRGIEIPFATREFPVGGKIASMIGRTDYVRVKIVDGKARLVATSGASNLSSTTEADGFIVVPESLEGHAEGELVNVYLYDQHVAL